MVPGNLQVPIFLTYSIVEGERKLPFPMSLANLSPTEEFTVDKRTCLGGGTWTQLELVVELTGMRVGRLPGGAVIKAGEMNVGRPKQTDKHVHFMI